MSLETIFGNVDDELRSGRQYPFSGSDVEETHSPYDDIARVVQDLQDGVSLSLSI